jgi:hypothetical protein
LWPALAASGAGLAALLVTLGLAGGLPVLPRIALGGLAYAGAAAWPLRRWVRVLADA